MNTRRRKYFLRRQGSLRWMAFQLLTSYGSRVTWSSCSTVGRPCNLGARVGSVHEYKTESPKDARQLPAFMHSAMPRPLQRYVRRSKKSFFKAVLPQILFKASVANAHFPRAMAFQLLRSHGSRCAWSSCSTVGSPCKLGPNADIRCTARACWSTSGQATGRVLAPRP